MTESNETGTPMSPGKLLQVAREAKGISQAEIAKRLHLSLQMIQEIEDDNYVNIHGLAYIRGYLRSYARLVDLNESTILRPFEELEPPKKIELPEKGASGYHYGFPIYKDINLSKRHNFLHWASWIIGLGLVMLVIMWWNDQKNHTSTTLQTPPQGSIKTDATTTPATSNPATESTTRVPVQSTPKSEPAAAAEKPSAEAKAVESAPSDTTTTPNADSASAFTPTANPDQEQQAPALNTSGSTSAAPNEGQDTISTPASSNADSTLSSPAAGNNPEKTPLPELGQPQLRLPPPAAVGQLPGQQDASTLQQQIDGTAPVKPKKRRRARRHRYRSNSGAYYSNQRYVPNYRLEPVR